MQTYTQIIYQVVFSTRRREPTIWKPCREELYAYMAGLLRNKRCTVFAIGGVDDHIHLVFSLHPSIALSDLVRDLKVASNLYLKSKLDIVPAFRGWSNGYGAFTYQRDCLHRLVRYVSNQERHHENRSSQGELRMMLEAHGVEVDDRYFA